VTRFTNIEAAIEEAHFIQNQLNETALITVDKHKNLFVMTRNQYESKEHSTDTVLEICKAKGEVPAR
jgi:hypothetical protein